MILNYVNKKKNRKPSKKSLWLLELLCDLSTTHYNSVASMLKHNNYLMELSNNLSRCRTTGPSFRNCYMETVHYRINIRVFPKWNRNLVNLANLINHCSMNWAEFKDRVFHMCLATAVVEPWSVTQEVAVLSRFVTEFSENIHYHITSWGSPKAAGLFVLTQKLSVEYPLFRLKRVKQTQKSGGFNNVETHGWGRAQDSEL